MRTSSQAPVFLRTLLLGGDFFFMIKTKPRLWGNTQAFGLLTSSRKA